MNTAKDVSEDTWVVVWSERENCFLVTGFSEFINKNQTCFFEGSRCNGYPLAFVPSEAAGIETARIFGAERDAFRGRGPQPTTQEVIEETGEIIMTTLEALGEPQLI